MTITIECPQCHQKYRVSHEAVGKQVRCPACQNVFAVPGAQLSNPPSPIDSPPQPAGGAVAGEAPSGHGVSKGVTVQPAVDRSQEPAPRFREYVHDRCGEVSMATEGDFSRLANPYVLVLQTYCGGCCKFVGLNSVAWRDTGETIAHYRRRLRAEVPTSLKICGFAFGPIGLILIGAGVGWLVSGDPLAGPVIGGVIGMILSTTRLMHVVARLGWGVDFRKVK